MDRNLDDWLEYYLKYTQNTEPPRLYHLWTGIAAIASCLQRKCWLDWGHHILYPNMYIVLVGPSGGRKGTAMKIAKGFLHDLNVILSSDSLGSIQTLYKELRDAIGNYRTKDGSIIEHRSLSVWSEEFQVFLADNDSRLISNLTDLYDCPSKWSYSTLKRGIEDLSDCWLNIFGAITPSLLQDSLSRAAVGGGLVSRMIFVVGYGKAKKSPIEFLSQEEKNLRVKLIEDLAKIKVLAGPFRPTEAYIEEYSKWYMSPESDHAIDSDKFVGYNERRAMHVRKLSMIISVSQNNAMILSKAHFERALYILKHTEKEMPNAFYGLGRGVHSDTLAELGQYIQKKKKASWKQIITRFQLDVLPNDLQNYLNLLEQTGMIKRETSVGGNTQYIYMEKYVKDTAIDYLKQTLFKQLDGNKGGNKCKK